MGSFTIRHEIDCTPERFWELFFDAELQKRIFAELEFPRWEVVDQRETDAEIVRVIRAVPKIDAPAPVMKVLGAGVGYTEEGRFDKRSKTYRFVIKPTTLADKVKNEGTVRCEPLGEGRCLRIVDGIAEAKVFGIGGMIEKMTEKSMRDGWAKGAAMFNAHLSAAR